MHRRTFLSYTAAAAGAPSVVRTLRAWLQGPSGFARFDVPPGRCSIA